ncbi:MAG: hypothetical protein HeimC3_35170 [Candidatus Heimdallarchaeota archaeon LC_3]|nr:MAG: hypothetical protein HeimC3_35170 [Candidatus Heimdallarchaeota archaeon LC_3]
MITCDIMPLIDVTSLPLTEDVKRKLIIELARTASEITGKELKYFTVIIREISGRESWGHQGKPLG